MRQYNRRKPGDHLPYVGIGILLWFPEQSSPRLRFLITFLFFFYTFISMLCFFIVFAVFRKECCEFLSLAKY